MRIRAPSGTTLIDAAIELHLPDLNFCRSFSRRKLYEAAVRLGECVCVTVMLCCNNLLAERICAEDTDHAASSRLFPPMPDIAVPIVRELCGPMPQQQEA